MKKKPILVRALLALLCILPAGRLQAAGAEEAFTLPEVVVTATKTNLDVKEVPAAVQVITRDDLEATGAQTLQDALSLSTGVHLVQAGGNRQAVSIRGFDSRFSSILIDGRRLAAEPDQAFELDRLSIENVERIEIVRGPVSSLYGTDALGGIVNIITRKATSPSFSLGANTGFFGAGDNTEHYNFSYHSGQQGKVSFSLSGSYRENDAMFKSSGLTYEPYGLRKTLDASLDYQLSGTETLNLTAGYMKEDTHEFTLNQIRDTWDHNLRNEQSITYSRDLEDGALFFRYYQGVLRKNRDQLNKNTGNLMNAASWVQSKRTMRSYEGRLTKAAGENHVLTFGAEYRPEEFKGTAVSTGEGLFTAYHPSGASKQGSTASLDYTAIYVQDEWSLSPKLLAITSLRYDDSNKFESNVSPKLGLTYKLAPDTRLKLNAGKGFRSPTPNQLYQNLSLTNPDANNLKGNPGLDSEKSNSFDFSLERDFADSAFKLTYFMNDVTNLIVANSGTGYVYQNIDKATLQGMEAEFTQTLSDKLSWSNGYTYLDAVDDSSHSRLSDRARHLLTSRLTYREQNNFTASLWAELYDDYILASKEKSYLLWNASMSRQLTDNAKFTLSVRNLLDKKDDDVPLMGIYVHSGVQFTF